MDKWITTMNYGPNAFMKWPALDYPQIGMASLEQPASDIMDAQIKFFVTAWFWPYFVMGNLDSWQKLGITLNGIKPIRC